MTSVVDLWRAIDPEAALISGGPAGLRRVVRGVMRTRVAPPHLPPGIEAGLLVADAGLAPADALLAALGQAGLQPVAVLLGGATRGVDPPSGSLPFLASTRPAARLAEEAAAYLADERAWLSRAALELRLLCAEAALADPEIGTPAGLIAARIRRGVAVSADGELRALHARPAGRALAARFSALHARLLAGADERHEPLRTARDGLWLVERQVRAGASVWIFDDLPLGAIDEVSAEALAVTLRALLRRPERTPSARASQPPVTEAPAPVGGDLLTATLVEVARHNGRVAPAARALGVHRNTVLYRLRRARAETGLDPRRPEDALRILSPRTDV